MTSIHVSADNEALNGTAELRYLPLTKIEESDNEVGFWQKPFPRENGFFVILDSSGLVPFHIMSTTTSSFNFVHHGGSVLPVWMGWWSCPINWAPWSPPANKRNRFWALDHLLFGGQGACGVCSQRRV